MLLHRPPPARASTRSVACLFALLGPLLLGGCETLSSVNPFAPASTSAPPASPETALADTAATIPYVPEIRIDGPEEYAAVLRPLLEKASRLVTLADRAPTSLERLRRRAEGDVERAVKILRSEGFYKGEARYRLEEDPTPLRAVLAVTPGPPFAYGAYRIRYQNAPVPTPAGFPATAADVGLTSGARARSADILDARSRIVARLGNSGHPRATVLDQTAVADFAAGTLSVDVVVDPGPAAVFGDVRVDGLSSVERELVDDFVTWNRGAPYRQDAVDALQKSLIGTRLFSSVVARPGERADADGTLPIDVRVEESEHRSVGAGVAYSTNTGAGVNTYWEHRNLLGQGERLRVNLKVAEIQQLLGATAAKPAYLRPDQTLTGEVKIERDRTEAYVQELIGSSVGLERTFGSTLTGRLGLSAEYSRVTDERGARTVQILGVPASVTRDTTDNLLDPTKGARLTFATTPFAGVDDESALSFWRNRLTGSAYLSVDEASRYVLAVRGEIGSITGISRRRVPAHHRLYSGGGGSVRGYGYQLIGPLDDENDPLGGRSFAELGLEARIRIGQSFGIVPFLEAGVVDESTLPAFDENIRYAAGIGGRYYTGFGPLRVDIAFPLNPRGLDDPFQFYVSLGQAF